MKKIASLCFIITFFLGQAFGWGQTGHRVVGLVAEQHLNKKARKQVMQILEQNSLAEVANWMDDIKSDAAYNHTHDWHWVTVLDGQKYEETKKNPNGDIIMKIDELTAALKTHKLPEDKEQEYLKYLVHLIGDLHQPLHVGGKDDSGGNAVKVQWFGEPSNLHRVWDSDIIDGKNLSFTELASFLDEPSPAQIKNLQARTLQDWTSNMMTYRTQVYNLPADGKLGYRYSYNNFKTIQQLLLEGGIHLAGLLNAIYG